MKRRPTRLQVEKMAERIEAFCNAQTAPHPMSVLVLSRQLYRDDEGRLRWGAKERTIYFAGGCPDELDARLADFKDFEGMLPDTPQVRKIIDEFRAKHWGGHSRPGNEPSQIITHFEPKD